MSLFVNEALRKAAEHAKKGNMDFAAQAYKSILEKFPQNKQAADGLKTLRQPRSAQATSNPALSETQFNVFLSLYKQGKFEEALAQGEALALQFPAVPIIPNLLGAVNVGLERLEQAVAGYGKALQLKPDFIEAYSNLGAVLNDLGRHEEAVSVLRKALQVKPNFAEVHNNLGNALNYLGRRQEAVASYDKALKLKPDFFAAHNNRGAALNDLGKPDEAVRSFAKALQIKPDFAEAHNNLGSALNDLGKPDEAVASLTRALQLMPDYADAYNNLGNSLGDLGRIAEAVDSYDKALQIKPDFAATHRNLSAAKTYQDGDAQIRQMLQLVERPDLSDKNRMYLGFALGKAHGDIGDYDQAFFHLVHGNRLLRKERPYNHSSAQLSFTRTKATFSEVIPALQGVERPVMENSSQAVFILGMPRSGTTLVEQILASHSHVYGAGELSLLTQSIRSVEWTSTLLTSDQLRSIRASYLSGLDRIGAPEPFITDKMPLNFRWIGFIIAALPEAKIIHVKRDARATCWSNFKQYFSRKGMGFANDLKDVAEFYKMYVDLMAFWHEKYPGRIYELNYESLTGNQEEETRNLLEYVGLDWEGQCIEFHETARAVQTASATQVRQKMYQGSSEEWRKYEKHLAPLIELLTGL